MSKMNFGEWARDIRTVALMAWNKHAFVRIREAEKVAAAKQDTINTRDEQVADLCADLEKYRDELQGEVIRRVRLERELDEVKNGYAIRNDEVTGLIGMNEELQRKLKNYEPVNFYDGLSIEQWRERALKAESVQRFSDTVIGCYSRSRARMLKRIAELTHTVQVSGDFIDMQTKRLINARNHVTRVRQACDELEPADNGAALDP